MRRTQRYAQHHGHVAVAVPAMRRTARRGVPNHLLRRLTQAALRRMEKSMRSHRLLCRRPPRGQHPRRRPRHPPTRRNIQQHRGVATSILATVRQEPRDLANMLYHQKRRVNLVPHTAGTAANAEASPHASPGPRPAAADQSRRPHRRRARIPAELHQCNTFTLTWTPDQSIQHQ